MKGKKKNPWVGAGKVVVAAFGTGAVLAFLIPISPAVLTSIGGGIVAVGAVWEVLARMHEEHVNHKWAGKFHNGGLSTLAIGASIIAFAPWGGA